MALSHDEDFVPCLGPVGTLIWYTDIERVRRFAPGVARFAPGVSFQVLEFPLSDKCPYGGQAGSKGHKLGGCRTPAFRAIQVAHD